MHPNAQLIQKFYLAFQSKDANTMASLYHPDAQFSDAVFTDLRGSQIGDMWRMLCERGADLTLSFRDISADDRTGKAHWDAHYTFSATKRKVHNAIDARFEFKDGKILRHQDTFSFHRWAAQALGPAGLLLGWTPIIRNKVRSTAAKNLASFIAKRGGKS